MSDDKEKPAFLVGFGTGGTGITSDQFVVMNESIEKMAEDPRLRAKAPFLAKVAGKRKWTEETTQQLFIEFCARHQEDPSHSLVGKFIGYLAREFRYAPTSKGTIYNHARPILNDIKKLSENQ